MTSPQTILAVGGAGYVGSHFVRYALDDGHKVIVLDADLREGHATRVDGATYVLGDMRITEHVYKLLCDHAVTVVAHFAGLIRVDESVADPLRYYEENVAATIRLLEAVTTPETAVRAFLFSSSAAVYGDPGERAVAETDPCRPCNPYGATKLAIEHLLAGLGHASGDHQSLPWAALRYFNAAGAHPDGTMREHHDPCTHLIPRAIDAALGTGPPLTIHGDGRHARDYVHVCDLADGHLVAMQHLLNDHIQMNIGPLNLGGGTPQRIGDVIYAVERVTGRYVPREHGPARPGDPQYLVANIAKARALDWAPTDGLYTIVEDAVRSRRGGTIAR